ncbi:P-loop containing nucleoside triphosphate hydrolase [Glarea lozoyensis ATCC 20868]|uniref:p-loop containing nucleoside triphosphate hydrolase n=1 Tax=Glarea lozoyensis (strain ATCC 20868 / MF5171) TaxID=1116229 RepID=S3DBR1_GLAL2|nr:P-loop containing nucleoside triphosphate hydrolase [Glarea lozoyensis ATCC 20868]EPE29406.1 P-loop containing nucleoside triphosphate hydrolase [Glarea lozoyensis ATCC 20868]
MAGMVLYKLVVLGDGGVGKSALTIQLTLEHFVETYEPTIEDSYRKQVIIDGKPCMLEILDTAGQEEYTALRDAWISDGDGFVLVYSITSRSSFTRIKKFHHQIKSVKERDAHPNLTITSPVCLVGNKCDRVTEREVSVQEGLALANELGCSFVEASAKNNFNTEKMFYDTARVIRSERIKVASSQARSGQSTSPRSSHGTSYQVRRSWWRKSIFIEPNEGQTEAGRKRLTYSLVDAAKSNLEREVLAFLDAGADIDGQPGPDGAAIHAASVSGHANIVNILIKRGTAINAKGPPGTSPLQIAAAEGHLPVVRLLIHKGTQIDQTSQLHGRALSAASSRGRLEVVRYLLKKKADVNVDGGPYGNALQAAAWAGKAPIVELLLGSGADINARGAGGCTALQIAAFGGHSSVIRSLLKLGGAININAQGALMILIESGARDPLKSVEDKLGQERSDSEARKSLQASNNSAVLRQISGTKDYTHEEVVSVAPLIEANDITIPVVEVLAKSMTRSTAIAKDPTSQPSVRRPHINSTGFSHIFDPGDAVVDIIFVHGLQGHPEQTWTYQPQLLKKRFSLSSTSRLTFGNQQNVFWPYDLLAHEDSFAKARILTWGYDSKVITEFFGTSNQHNISQHGNDLMIALQQERKHNPSRPLIFVAHSLGGILVKVALDSSKRSVHQPQYLPIYTSTKAILFLGTPHGGSTSTSWGLLASNLTKFALQSPSEKVLKGLNANSELLENLRKVFLQMLEDNKFMIHSFFETKPMSGLYGLQDRVVPYESALVGHARQEIVRGINGNHSEICKFKDATDPGYKAVSGALEDYILALRQEVGLVV